MKCSYIAIEREYGSGGTEIARRLSEESGVPYYGREILEKVSKDYGIPISQIEKYEEKHGKIEIGPKNDSKRKRK